MKGGLKLIVLQRHSTFVHTCKLLALVEQHFACPSVRSKIGENLPKIRNAEKPRPLSNQPYSNHGNRVKFSQCDRRMDSRNSPFPSIYGEHKIIAIVGKPQSPTRSTFHLIYYRNIFLNCGRARVAHVG